MIEDRALLQLGQALLTQKYRFTTVSPATHARVNARPGNEWARDVCDIFGWSRPFLPEVLPASIFDLMREAGLLEPAGDGWRSAVRFSTLPTDCGEILLAHSAYPTSAADAVFFGPDTYRFNAAVQRFLDGHPGPIRRALDLGCGSGAAAIAIARASPAAEVIGSDINDAALRMTRANAALAGASVALRHSDLFADIDGDFDLIVANPPFLLDPGRRRYRHGGGERGEALSLTMVTAALPRLRRGGALLLYTGVAIVDGVDPLLGRLRELLSPLPLRWTYSELDPDIFGEELEAGAYIDVDRIAAVVLTVCNGGNADAA